ncbi:WAP four-disulfide core domain protein 3-like [Paramacrobiotus metropolitanus]|uniref:WAP four-disulfide core domain protein 3-like n=1 Tax=Paramacrobiotus metropolitanus TaxID=2943436 RepID=UPI00244632F3|nr:WAP four-disulfide core domain protein 3-like [Paramacrobiotus metropolitanus]
MASQIVFIGLILAAVGIAAAMPASKQLLPPPKPVLCGETYCRLTEVCATNPILCMKEPCEPRQKCVPYDVAHRPGKCPTPHGPGFCLFGCDTDTYCQEGHKCCSNGCGQVCMPRVFA